MKSNTGRGETRSTKFAEVGFELGDGVGVVTIDVAPERERDDVPVVVLLILLVDQPCIEHAGCEVDPAIGAASISACQPNSTSASHSWPPLPAPPMPGSNRR